MRWSGKFFRPGQSGNVAEMFRNLDPARKYHAIAYDHTGQYDPVIKLNLIPTVD